jgi:hypothetical protein
LSTRYIYYRGVVQELSGKLVYRQVAHEENKSNPWHERPLYILSNAVGSNGAQCERSDTNP